MTHGPEALTAQGLSYRYGRLRILEAVDFSLGAGERVALRGANGAGKTTLLRILAGLLRPQHGTVRCREGGVAFVGQAAQAYPELSVAENLRLFAHLHGLADPERATAEALEAFGLEARPRQRARHLSRGQLQRLALARAFIASPRVVLLDEPWTALDAAGAALLDRAVRAAADGGAAVCFSAHDDGRAAALAERGVTLAGGRLSIDVDARGGHVERDARRSTSPGREVPTVALIAAPAVTAVVTPSVASAVSPDGSPIVPAPRRPLGVLRGAWLIARKDVLTELRAREILPAIGVFAALCGVVLAYAFGDATPDLPRVAPGAYWVALLFGGTLGLGRMMASEVDTDALSALRLTRLDAGSLFLGKWAAATAFALLVALAMAPVWVALFALRPADIGGLLAVAAAGLPGWAAAGVLVAAVSATARGREALLPILLFPLLLPLVLGAVRATGAVLANAPLTDLGPALALLGAFDVIFCVIGFWLFPLVVEST